MSTIRIEQFSGEALGNKGFMQMPQLPSTAPAQVIASSSASQASAALSPNTRALRIRVTGTPPVAIRVGSVALIGGDPVALATDPTVQDGEVMFFGIDPGLVGRSDLKVAFIDAP